MNTALSGRRTVQLSLADQVDFSNVHQPGTAMFTVDTTLSTPTTAGKETINYASAPLISTTPAVGTALFGASPFNTPYPADFGQKSFTNNLTGSWEATSRLQLSLTYRYRTHRINEGLDGTDNAPLTPGATNNGDVTINENGSNRQRSLSSDAELEHQRHGRSALRRQLLHAGWSAADPALPSAFPVPAQALGDDLRRIQRSGTPQQHQQ